MRSRVHGSFRNPAPDLSVFIGVHREPEHDGISFALQDLRFGILGKQFGPGLHVIGDVPDHLKRRADPDGIVSTDRHGNYPAFCRRRLV